MTLHKNVLTKEAVIVVIKNNLVVVIKLYNKKKLLSYPTINYLYFLQF